METWKDKRDALVSALDEVQKLDNKPVLRQCCICKEWLDGPSEIIAEVREKIEHVISHGYCLPCEKKVQKEQDEYFNKLSL